MSGRFLLSLLSVVALSAAWPAEACDASNWVNATEVVLARAEVSGRSRHAWEEQLRWGCRNPEACTLLTMRVLRAHGLDADPMKEPRSEAALCSELQKGRMVVVWATQGSKAHVFIMDKPREKCSEVRMRNPHMQSSAYHRLADWYRGWNWWSGVSVAR